VRRRFVRNGISIRLARLMTVVVALCTVRATRAASAPPDELVIVLEPANAAPAVLRSLARIKDELAADRYRVAVADARTATAAGSVMEQPASESDQSVVLALFGDPDSGQAELWVAARGPRRLAVRRVHVVAEVPEQMPSLLAARALELVRATSLELSFDVETTAEASPPRDVQAPPPKTSAARTDLPRSGSPAPSALDFDAGVALFSSVDGPGPAILTVGRLRWHFASPFYGRVSLMGLGTEPRIETSYGSATVSQSVGLIELGAVFRRHDSLRPNVSLGAGALHVTAAGVGKPPYEGRDSSRWSATLDGGLGFAFGVTRSVALALELHGLVAIPHPTVTFADQQRASVGFPSLVLSAALQVAP
jgi:hypothetical protein